MKAVNVLLHLTKISAFVPLVKNCNDPLRRIDFKKNMKNEIINHAASLNTENNVEMSRALPFLQRPRILDGSLPGDAGFDPFGFAGNDEKELLNMRESEIKHGRLAMLAVVGWPLAELWDKQIAVAFGLQSALTDSGESPSLLNGGLDRINIDFWIASISLASLIELSNLDKKQKAGNDYIPGDCNFDPLHLFPTNKSEQIIMQTKEIKHGRIAMIAILGFIVQEAIYGTPVTLETPFFFTPIWSYFFANVLAISLIAMNNYRKTI